MSLPSAPFAGRLSIPSRAYLRSQPLRTERLTLNAIDPADGPSLWQAVDRSRAHLGRWLPWVPFNQDEQSSQRYADACARDWDAERAMRFAIRCRSTGSLLGVVSLDNCVHLHRNCDLGYWLDAGVTGRGLMTEAARRCVRFAFEEVGLHRIRCAAATGNLASLGVLKRLSEFKHEGTARQAELVAGAWLDHQIYGAVKSDRPSR